MPKLSVILLLFVTTAMYWHQTDAKPFLFLPANFFDLTTRAPTTYSIKSSTSYSAPSTTSTCGGFISRKLSFISSLLAAFGTNGGIGGSFGFGINFHGGITTHKPKTTTTSGSKEPDTIFTPEVSTKSPETTIKSTSTSEKSSTATSTEKSVVSITTETSANEVQPIVVDPIAASPTTTNIANTQITNGNDGAAGTGVAGNNFKVPTGDNKEDIKKSETVGEGVSGLGIDTASGSEGGVILSGVSGGSFGNETPRPDIDNEIFSGNVQNTYLPVQKE